MYDKLLTVSEAARLLGVSASTLRRMERNGFVEGYGLKVIYTPGGQRRYVLNEIQHLYSQQGFSGEIGFGNKPALLIRDLTRAFTDTNSKLAIELKEQIEVASVLIKTAKDNRIPIVFSKTIYNPSHHFSRLWGRKLPSLQVLEPNSDWVQVNKELEDYTFDFINETVYVHDFFQSSLNDFLMQNQIDTVILAGTTTSGSIRATAVEAFQLGYHVIIPEEAVGDRNQAIQSVALLDLNARYADVFTMEQTLKHMAKE